MHAHVSSCVVNLHCFYLYYTTTVNYFHRWASEIDMKCKLRIKKITQKQTD